MRTPFIVGNWKMNLERKSALGLVARLRDHLGDREDLECGVAPSFVYLEEIARVLAGSSIAVGAQNCCDERSGAFTGEVSAEQLMDVGCDFVVVGHSERRHLYGEGNELVNRKVHAALDAGLDVMLCVGETLDERDAKRTEEIIGTQLRAGLNGIDAPRMQRVTIAYEPVWAIGTGRNATPEQAGAAHVYLRGVLSGLYNEPLSNLVRILYGGSVKPANVRALMAASDVDGCLVGGASIQAETFLPLFDFR